MLHACKCDTNGLNKLNKLAQNFGERIDTIKKLVVIQC